MGLKCKRTLEKEVKGCKHLVLWTDGDREGENIAEEIAIVCLNGELFFVYIQLQVC